MKSYKKKIELDRRFIVIFISAGIWALLAHGMALFNKYSFHDDIGALNSVGNTYSLGRWMLGILDRIVKFITGSDHYSLPLTNGIITILCIGIVVYIISDKLKIESLILNILLCGVFISFPTITGIFGYMFTAPYYYFGTLLGVLGAYLFDKNRNIVTALFCTTLMACSAGVYQANIPICICTLLLFMIVNMSEFSSEWKLFWKETCINIGICIGFIVEYFVINKLKLPTPIRCVEP